MIETYLAENELSFVKRIDEIPNQFEQIYAERTGRGIWYFLYQDIYNNSYLGVVSTDDYGEIHDLFKISEWDMNEMIDLIDASEGDK